MSQINMKMFFAFFEKNVTSDVTFFQLFPFKHISTLKYQN